MDTENIILNFLVIFILCNARSFFSHTHYRSLSRLSLDHTLEQFIDLVLTIAKITSVDVVIVLLAPAASWCVQFEGPEEVVHLLEDTSSCVKLVDHVLDALDVVSLSQFTLDGEVVGERNALAGVLDESALIQQLASRAERWIAEGLK